MATNLFTQSINLQFTTTSSVAFLRPVQQTTLLDSSNQKFLRQLMLSSDGIKVIRGLYAIQIPSSQIFAAAFAALPSMSWSPIVSTQITSSVIVYPKTGSRATASMTFATTDEFNNDITYAWRYSGSYTSGWTVPVNNTTWSFQGTGSTNLSASLKLTSSIINPTYFFATATNPAGTLSSSICTVSSSI